MNIKRWFAWACLALMLVAEIFLFLANREKDAALLSLRDTQVQLHQTQTDLAELKNSNVGLQASEILRLRKQNEIITNRFAALETTIATLSAENESNAQHLATARLALKLQQQHLAELETANQQIQTTSQQIQQVATAEATNAAVIIAKKTCVANLRHIDDAKQEWASDNNKADSAVPTVNDLLIYLPDAVFPTCPSGGTYSINAVNEVPTCSFAGHVLP
jgi:chromosome segregation ATPase